MIKAVAWLVWSYGYCTVLEVNVESLSLIILIIIWSISWEAITWKDITLLRYLINSSWNIVIHNCFTWFTSHCVWITNVNNILWITNITVNYLCLLIINYILHVSYSYSNVIWIFGNTINCLNVTLTVIVVLANACYMVAFNLRWNNYAKLLTIFSSPGDVLGWISQFFTACISPLLRYCIVVSSTVEGQSSILSIRCWNFTTINNIVDRFSNSLS